MLFWIVCFLWGCRYISRCYIKRSFFFIFLTFLKWYWIINFKNDFKNKRDNIKCNIECLDIKLVVSQFKVKEYQQSYFWFCFSPREWILFWVHGRIGQMEQRILLSCFRWEPRCILLWDWKPQILLHQERPSHSIGGSRVSIKICSMLENI